jgi:hypothetical protein
MNTLYANGCSLTFGMEIINDHSYSTLNTPLAWPHQLAQLQAIESVHNSAYCGASNEFIMRTTINDLIKRQAQGENPKDVLVVIGWTSICRQQLHIRDQVESLIKQGQLAEDFYCNDTFRAYRDHGSIFMNGPGFNQWLNLRNGKRYQLVAQAMPVFVDMIWQEQLEQERWAIQQLSLAAFLESQGYRWLFFNSVHAIDAKSIDSSVYERISGPNFYDPFWAFQPWYDCEFPQHIRACGHPDAVPHQALAQRLHDYLQTNALIA